MTLGFGYAFTGVAVIPTGGLIAAIVLSGLFIIFEVLVYASMIAVMPRAGGDYVWQTRVFGGGIGFVLAATGWWFILWHWVPIYANILILEVIQPILNVLGYNGTDTFHAAWWNPIHGTGIFIASILTAVIATVVVSAGMSWYARFQKWCFYGAMVGLVFMIAVFLLHSKADFITAFNNQTDIYGTHAANAYQGTVGAAHKADLSFQGYGSSPLRATFLLIPFMLFFNLWPNWGATLYGEVRGASDFRKNIYAMGGALLFTTVVVLITFAAMAHAMGFRFLRRPELGVLGSLHVADVLVPVPGHARRDVLLQRARSGRAPAASLTVVLRVGGQRVPELDPHDLRRGLRPDPARVGREGRRPHARSHRRARADVAALHPDQLPVRVQLEVLLVHPRRDGRHRDHVLRRRPWPRSCCRGGSPRSTGRRRSPSTRWPASRSMTLAGVVFGGFLAFCIYKWFTDDVYGVNHSSSLRYMLILYVVAIGIYIASRVVRRREGIDLARINAEIPVE